MKKLKEEFKLIKKLKTISTDTYIKRSEAEFLIKEAKQIIMKTTLKLEDLNLMVQQISFGMKKLCELDADLNNNFDFILFKIENILFKKILSIHFRKIKFIIKNLEFKR